MHLLVGMPLAVLSRLGRPPFMNLRDSFAVWSACSVHLLIDWTLASCGRDLRGGKTCRASRACLAFCFHKQQKGLLTRLVPFSSNIG